MWRMKRNEIHVKKIAARKVERDRVKRLKEMSKTLALISIELYDYISDSKTLWKATNEIWIAEKAKKIIRKNMRETNSRVERDEKNDEKNKKTEILVEKKTWLQNDFFSFELSFEEDALNYKKDARYARYARNSKDRNNQKN
jgi:hypothetical protein